MKKIIVASLVMLVQTFGVQAQEGPKLAQNTTSYHTAVGLRVGGTSGLTIKQFLGQSAALEGILGLWNHGLSATLLYERYAPTGAPGLNWYYGAGGHVAFDTGHTVHFRGHHYYNKYRHDELGLGIDGILGIEYKIPPVPFAVSVDMKPFMEFTTSGDVWLSLDPSIGIKLTF